MKIESNGSHPQKLRDDTGRWLRDDEEHPWRHRHCEPCRQRRADYSKRWMKAHRTPRTEEQARHRRERRREIKGAHRATNPRVCDWCGMSVMEHELQWCRPRRTG